MSKAQHSCDEEIRRDDWAMSGFRQDGDRWTCSCGKKYQHVEDEAEGGGWIAAKEHKEHKK